MPAKRKRVAPKGPSKMSKVWESLTKERPSIYDKWKAKVDTMPKKKVVRKRKI